MNEFDNLNDIRDFIASGRMRLLYISRPSCGVCTAVKPKVIDIIEKYEGLEGTYVDLDRIPEAAGEFSIFTIPGILLYIDGREMIREARFISIEELESRIDRFHSMIFD